MNIFYLDKDPEKCAVYHNNKHVVKMILETAQLLCSVHYYYPTSYTPKYKLTHKNHPSTIWARSSISNYVWLCKLGKALCKEYTFRYGRRHITEDVIDQCLSHIPSIPDDEFSDPPLAMPEYCKMSDAVESYRKYYINEKAYFCEWKKRNIPEWFIEGKT